MEGTWRLLEGMCGCRVGQSHFLLPFAISSGYCCHCRLEEERQSQGSERQRVSFSQFLLLPSSIFFLFYHLNKGEHHHSLRSCTYRWFPVTAKHTVTGSEREEVKWGWERVWWISLFDVCVEMKNSRGSSSSSLHVSHSFTLSHSFDQEKVHESYTGCKMCLLKAKDCLVCGPSALFKQEMSTFVIFYCCNLWLIVTPHISWMSVCVCSHSLSRSLSPKWYEVSLQPKIIRASVWVHRPSS